MLSHLEDTAAAGHALLPDALSTAVQKNTELKLINLINRKPNRTNELNSRESFEDKSIESLAAPRTLAQRIKH